MPLARNITSGLIVSSGVPLPPVWSCEAVGEISSIEVLALGSQKTTPRF